MPAVRHLLLLLYLSLFGKSEHFECGFFKEITLRVTPKTKFPYPRFHERKSFSGCIQQNVFDEIVTKIVLFDQNITNIGDHAVSNMPELQELIFTGCPVENISRLAFRNVPKLKELYIRFGKLKDITTEIFNEIDSLEIIDIQENQIEKIALFAFGYMPELKQVVAANNKLPQFFSAWFRNSTNLELIDFRYNRLATLTFNIFDYFPKLTDIFFDFNEIRSIEARTFKHLNTLVYLGLSHNKLTKIDANIFPRNVRIDLFLINANYLNYLSEDLMDKLSVKELTIESNPWDCHCIQRIYSWLRDVNGTLVETNFCKNVQIPICLYPKNLDTCSESVNEDITETYIKTLKRLNPPVTPFCAQLNED